MQRSLLLLQLADSAFPTGGFAHSGGLEAAVQLGEVQRTNLRQYILHSLEQAGMGALPIVTAAHGSPERVIEFDQYYDAFLTNQVANQASRALGKAWIVATFSAFGTAALQDLRARAREESFSGHFAPIFGTVAAFLDVSRDDTQRLFLFLHVRSLISSAIRLDLVGPLQAQAMQYQFSEAIESVLSRCAGFREQDLVTIAPLVDLFQGHHNRLYSRLFSS